MQHILRGLGGSEFQVLPVEPSALVTFEAESDRVLDLRDVNNQIALGLPASELGALDNRYIRNRAGDPTDLQRLGAAIYRSGRFSGLIAPSRYDDIITNYSFNFLPGEVNPRLRDVEKVLDSL